MPRPTGISAEYFDVEAVENEEYEVGDLDWVNSVTPQSEIGDNPKEGSVVYHPRMDMVGKIMEIKNSRLEILWETGSRESFTKAVFLKDFRGIKAGNYIR